MVFTINLIKTSLLLFVFVLLSSCTEEEFYEKEYLDGMNVAKEEVSTNSPTSGDDSQDSADPDPGISDPTNPDNNLDDPNTGSTDPNDPNSTPTTPGDGGSTTPTDPSDPTDPNDPNNPGGDDDNTTNDPNDPNTPGDDNTNDPGDNGPNLQTVTDSFIQNSSVEEGKVDIVWVVDNSGSMGDEQASLAYNFDVFINEFIQKQVDFQMAITTTDARDGYNGQMVCDQDLLNAQAASTNQTQFVNDFKECIQVGTGGSGTEQGLLTSESFVSRYAANFIRPDAYLIFVVVSDEEEQSTKAVSDYVSFFQSYKTNPGLVKIYSIITTELIGNQWETIGYRYQEASNLTGGTVSSIKEDFYYVLRDMGGSIVNLLDSFALSQIPYDSNITVTVNGTEVTTGWTYDPVTRSVKFDTQYVPGVGSNIEITYSVEASP